MIVVATSGLFGFAVLHGWIEGAQALVGLLGACVFGRRLQVAVATVEVQPTSKHTWLRDLSWAFCAFLATMAVSWIYMLKH